VATDMHTERVDPALPRVARSEPSLSQVHAAGLGGGWRPPTDPACASARKAGGYARRPHDAFGSGERDHGTRHLIRSAATSPIEDARRRRHLPLLKRRVKRL
jgi:hypothetical protein